MFVSAKGDLTYDIKSVYIAGLFDENFDWGREISRPLALINNHSDGWNDDIFNDGTF
jgi:hypothetical protein